MSSYNYLFRFPRVKKNKLIKKPALARSPQKKGICLKVYILPPKKPHSAKRKVAKVRLTTRKTVIAYIPGEGHNLQQYSNVLVQGGRVRDLPGVRYKMIRGKHDLQGILKRCNSRSRYGTKAWLMKIPRRRILK
jgi:small subunit ribosomal protein S12